ncbi:divalent metal cation transporter [Micromonospora sp. NPDC006431]|uniref:divalent metal cation transporter n=1 Tax=Micromonospora sp. NPDC006431 TaxID=3364235 RepID=UPI003697495F
MAAAQHPVSASGPGDLHRIRHGRRGGHRATVVAGWPPSRGSGAHRHIPLFVRRGLTMLPALLVLGLGLPATDSLVVSQVVLSFGIPFVLVPLLLLTRRADVMGSFVNSRATTAAAGGIAAVIIVLNVYLLYVTFLG